MRCWKNIFNRIYYSEAAIDSAPETWQTAFNITTSSYSCTVSIVVVDEDRSASSVIKHSDAKVEDSTRTPTCQHGVRYYKALSNLSPS
ncbi:hypothetical protein GPJ56_004243 [Histomonas meleagridis]|nr:hypothetical protein GPJ56_004243 [Histomonas meleagridis]